ncbi:MAG: uridine kinase [Crocinitomicaceae bacterium]|nr:uridine kinase [Crocinitomicaceae bacterium]
MIIGICGGSGSGKTTLLRRLCNEYRSLNPSVFSLDNYYLPIEMQQKDSNGIVNFDLPSALDRNKIIEDLNSLISGSPIKVKEYNFNSPPHINNYIDIDPSDLIIVEGLFLFYYSEIKRHLDMSVYVTVDSDVQLKRRINRDQSQRGYSIDDIIYQWENHVNPCHSQYIEPYKNDADYFFRNDSNAENDFLNLKRNIDILMKKKKVHKESIR